MYAYCAPHIGCSSLLASINIPYPLFDFPHTPWNFVFYVFAGLQPQPITGSAISLQSPVMLFATGLLGYLALFWSFLFSTLSFFLLPLTTSFLNTSLEQVVMKFETFLIFYFFYKSIPGHLRHTNLYKESYFSTCFNLTTSFKFIKKYKPFFWVSLSLLK